MVLEDCTKRRIVYYNRFGLTPGKIVSRKATEGKLAGKVLGIMLCYRARGTLTGKPCSGRPGKITKRVKELVEARLRYLFFVLLTL